MELQEEVNLLKEKVGLLEKLIELEKKMKEIKGVEVSPYPVYISQPYPVYQPNPNYPNPFYPIPPIWTTPQTYPGTSPINPYHGEPYFITCGATCG